MNRSNCFPIHFTHFRAQVTTLLVTGFALLLFAPTVLAQGILYPRPEIREQPFFVKSVRVSSVLNDSVAETTVEQTFVNDSSIEQEGTYLFPLPDGATVTSFSLKAGDKVMEARMLSKEEARGIYEAIVRRRRDPALLEYVGRGVFRASVFPIPAHGERLLTLKYAEVLKPEGTVKKFSYPLSTGRFSTRPIPVSSVSVRLKTTVPLKTVYSPSHDISVRRIGEHEAAASWEGHGEIPDRDFTLYYATNADDVGLSLLTYPTGDNGGYFMLIAAPRVNIPKERILPKQIVFVLDRTGSMASNNKMAQARNAMKYCLDSLNANDRFDVITFNESADVLTRSLVPASPENVAKAQKFVAETDASGGTNIEEALRAALGLLKNETGTQKMVVFMTDGLPTVGETNVETILANVKRMNGGERVVTASLKEAQAKDDGTRIFSFGVGYDVNVPFLDRLSEQAHATADYVRPEENIESIVSSFYGKVSSPILSRVSLAFDGIETYDVYPKEMPDLFKNGQLIVAGRYRGNTAGTVRLSGYAQNQPANYKLANAFGDGAARSPLVSRIWATRKIGFLLDQVRLHSNKEVVDEIVRLSKEYGIITPYTSYLADERQDALVNQPVTGPTVRFSTTYNLDSAVAAGGAFRAREELKQLSDRDTKATVGAEATLRALNSRGYQDANRAPASNQGGFGGGGLGGGRSGLPASGGVPGGPGGATGRNGLALDYSRVADQVAAKRANKAADNRPAYQQAQEESRVQAVGGRVFYRRNNIWFDNNYPSGQKVIKVQALSDAHFQLLRARPELNKYAAVGDETVINLGKVSVQFGKEGKDKLTDAEIKELTEK